MTSGQETHKDLILAEFFSVIVSLGLYLFFKKEMGETGAVLVTSAVMLLVTAVSLAKAQLTLAAATVVAIGVLTIAGLSGTHFGSGGMRSFVFSIGLLYFTLMALPIWMVYAGLRYRWSAISLLAEGFLVWAGLSHLPKFL